MEKGYTNSEDMSRDALKGKEIKGLFSQEACNKIHRGMQQASDKIDKEIKIAKTRSIRNPSRIIIPCSVVVLN